MRLILLLLILTVSTQAGLLDAGKVKEFFKGKVPSIFEKVKEKTMTKFKKLFEKTGILTLGKKLTEVRSKVMKKLELSKVKTAEIQEKLKEVEARRDDSIDNEEDTIFAINAGQNVGRELFQSDILLTKRQLEEVMESVDETGNREKRQAFRNEYYPNTTWTDGIFYRFDASADNHTRRMFVLGAQQWEEASCVNFTEDKDRKAENSIVLIKANGCWSYVGRLGGEQPLSLGWGCEQAAIATHELGHALGLFHTMSRYDRDDFITVVPENVVEGFVDQYIKETNLTTTNYGSTYDYGSIMHYGASSASRNTLPTMIANDTNYQESMGSYILSFIDKSMINDHYNCKEMCPNDTSARCENGGFPHPRNCSECICPSGYGGALCDQKVTHWFLNTRWMWRSVGSECYHTTPHKMNSASIRPASEKTLSSATTGSKYAPEGKKIEVTVKSISHGYGNDGCTLGGVEIKTSEDQIRTGYRFCSSKHNNTVLISASNRVPVITFNRYDQHEIILEYKIAS
ncbi:astacin [Cooperia oncophora]